MKLKIYQIDAFTTKLFGGNPAAVVFYNNNELTDSLMQKIASENNLSETAFVTRSGDLFLIRWFTPGVEVNLCGHATLAAAYALFYLENYSESVIKFISKSGILEVKKEGELLTLNFPSDWANKEEESIFDNCFNISPTEVYRGKDDYLLLYNSQEAIENLIPDFQRLKQIKSRGIIATAKGNTNDYVIRWFGPQSGIDEDPATGSAQTVLHSFWKERLNKENLYARQLSARTADFYVSGTDDRVFISGYARLYSDGFIHLTEGE